MKINSIYTKIFVLVLLASCSNDDRPGDIIQDAIVNQIEEPNSEAYIPTDDFGRIPCANGMSGDFPCNDYDLMSHLTVETMGVTRGNDIWGWTDTLDGKEYALVGGRQGTVFVDITDAEQPTVLGILPTATEESTWRDIKVYNDYAFIVSEAPNHGMQVFDLTRLRDVPATPATFDADAMYNEFGDAHNIVINEDTGYAYAVGTATFDGGPHFINIQDPLNPIAAGGYQASGYTHDAQVIIYNGPDTDYQGSEIFLGSNENELVLIDVTNKDNPTLISTISYTDVGYTHQGWISEDHTYFFANDEVDESQFGFNTRTLVFDFTDLDNPTFLAPFEGPTQAIDHNLYVSGNTLFLSNYTAGMRVADISDTNAPFDIGSFDTFPDNNNTAFNGVWSIYPYFASGNIIINDVSNGLFIVRKTGS